MSGILRKIRENLKNGTLLKNGVKAVSNRVSRSVSQSNALIAFDEDRKVTRDYLNEIPKINSHHIKAANYFLDSRVPLDSNSIIYSLGILEDVGFEEFVKKNYDSQLYLYDPTPQTIKFIGGYKDASMFNYFPYAVWTENKELKFTTAESGGSSSAVFNLGTDFFLAQAYTMKHLMNDNNHQTIDVWKADIEGAALPILEQMISQSILPRQIIVELERPRDNKEEMNDFFSRVTQIRDKLKGQGYEEYSMPRGTAKYFSLELLFVKP